MLDQSSSVNNLLQPDEEIDIEHYNREGLGAFSIQVQTERLVIRNQGVQYEDRYSLLANKAIQIEARVVDAGTRTC